MCHRLLTAAVIAASLWFASPSRSAEAQPAPPGARSFSIARLKYGGGGDWYENRTSLVNLIRGLRTRTTIPVVGDREAVVEPGDAALFQYPFVFASGHGNIKFTPAEVENLRRYLVSGGFLWVDDDFGIDVSIRREMKRVFPDAAFVELPFTHGIFHGLYDFTSGLPKIHEHSGGPARGFGIVHDGRLVVFYSYDCDLGDGLEDEEVHHDPVEKRDAALRMSMNLVHYALTH
ncbi:MAG: DUF4159 domain-containing protein [Candidatus Eisenbacteria bacterium]|uniref:DUF4159 domain-containing protein n=1 Tax=Eiseniibacteriota bacterium TaxID=2212470 RepID=A0A849SKX5_UNCEI|nr:DUF4159 domain-containing protein [Candidatus Eisenbacteria bacterium]